MQHLNEALTCSIVNVMPLLNRCTRILRKTTTALSLPANLYSHRSPSNATVLRAPLGLIPSPVSNNHHIIICSSNSDSNPFIPKNFNQLYQARNDLWSSAMGNSCHTLWPQGTHWNQANVSSNITKLAPSILPDCCLNK